MIVQVWSHATLGAWGSSPTERHKLRVGDGKWNRKKKVLAIFLWLYLCKLVHFTCYLISKLLEVQMLGQSTYAFLN